MPKDFDKTTGKDYKQDPARRCNACKRIFPVVRTPGSFAGKIRCLYCGSVSTAPYQRTTATLPCGE